MLALDVLGPSTSGKDGRGKANMIDIKEAVGAGFPLGVLQWCNPSRRARLHSTMHTLQSSRHHAATEPILSEKTREQRAYTTLVSLDLDGVIDVPEHDPVQQSQAFLERVPWRWCEMVQYQRSMRNTRSTT